MSPEVLGGPSMMGHFSGGVSISKFEDLYNRQTAINMPCQIQGQFPRVSYIALVTNTATLPQKKRVCDGSTLRYSDPPKG